MNYKTMLKKLLRSFIMVFMLIYLLNAVLSTGGFAFATKSIPIILLLTLCCSFITLILFVPREPTKKSYLIRHSIHLVLTIAVVDIFALLCGWAGGRLLQILFISLTVIAVTVLISSINYFLDKQTAKKLETALQKYKEKTNNQK